MEISLGKGRWSGGEEREREREKKGNMSKSAAKEEKQQCSEPFHVNVYLENLSIGNNQDKFNMHKNVHTSV